MVRHNIPKDHSKDIIAGYYDSETGELSIQIGLIERSEHTKAAIIIDASQSMQKHFASPRIGNPPSLIETFMYEASETIANRISEFPKIHVYLCCLDDGTGVLDRGNFTPDELKELRINLQDLKRAHGQSTFLLPALQEVLKDIVLNDKIGYGFLTLVTDGKIDDIDDIKIWAADLAHKIRDEQHPPIKIVLIGFADADKVQMEELDNLQNGTPRIDIFNALWYSTLQEAMFMLNSESIYEDNMLIATKGHIEVDREQIYTFKKGVPKNINVVIPPNLHSITLVLIEKDDEERINVPLVKGTM